MIVRPTVLILGAGASQAYGFPTGAELKRQVVGKLHEPSRDVLHEYDLMGCEPGDVIEFGKALVRSGAPSVDAFLEHRQGFVKIGKTAIAQALIPFEDEKSLFGRDKDWYGYLLGKLNAPLERFDQNKISVLTFNYDRSLEWYLFQAIQARFGVTGNEALELLSLIPIVHLYGTLGGLPWDGRPYDPLSERSRIYEARDKIKIIHEEVAGDPDFEKGKTAVAAAQKIVLIGVGLNNPANLQRLSPDSWLGANLRVFASALGMTDREMKSAARHLGEHVELGKNLEFGQSDWEALRFLRELVDFDS